MPRRCDTIILAFTLLLLTSLPACADWKARFLQEAPQRWSHFEQLATQLSGSYTEIMTDNLAPKKPTVPRQGGQPAVKPRYPARWDRDFFINGTMTKTVESTGSTESISGSNPDYSFSISRKRDKGEFTIQSLRRSSDGDAAPVSKSQILAQNDELDRLHAPWHIHGKSLLWWIRAPGFVILDVKPLERGGGERVKVDFRFTSPDGNEMKHIFNGFVILDPGRGWRVDEFQGVKTPGIITAQLAYGEDDGEFPRLTERVVKLQRKDGTVSSRTLTFSRLERRSIPHQDFLISSYGLPEPSSSDAGAGFPYWVLVAILWVMVLGYLLFRKLGGHGSRSSPSSTKT